MATQSKSIDPQSVPLCVDLDGTLLHSDLLLESLLLFVVEQPWSLWRIFWQIVASLWKGRAWLKRTIAESTTISPETLPYNQEVLEWLRSEKARGRRLVLVTASDEIHARRVAGYLGLFDEVHGSDGTCNLKGERKRQLLLERFRERGFDYAGNSAADLPVWQSSRNAIVVSSSEALAQRAGGSAAVERSFRPRPAGWSAYFRLLRPHQWFKNVLLFVPLITSHKLLHFNLELRCLAMFVAFAATASALYIWNDLLDLPSDRSHPTKRLRPLASGAIEPSRAMLLAAALFAAGIADGAMIGSGALAILLLYSLASIAYSVRLKRLVLVDVFTLAFLYMIRVLGGGTVTGVVVSQWLLAFTLFWFLSLALAKRVAELYNLAPGGSARGRGYRAADREQLNMFGVASGILASLVLALYIDSDQVRTLYLHPAVLWLMWPILLFWLLRFWLITHRGELNEDPVVFAVRDGTSYLLGGLCAIIMFLANSAWASDLGLGR